MNLVGKIFIVLIFVMSLVFMSFAVAVYATHQNWREVVERKEPSAGHPLGLKFQLEQQQKRNTDLKDEHERLQNDLKNQLAAKRDALTALELKYATISKERKDLEDAAKDLESKSTSAVATMNAAQKNLASSNAEVVGLRKEIRDTQGERDKQYQEVLRLSEKNTQLQGEVARFTERNMQLASDVAQAKKLLAAHNLTITDPIVNAPPSDVHGKIVAVSKDKMVELSLGKDDGLKEGHTLEVYRGSTYLGRVEVSKVTFNRAVARLIPGYQQGIIQKGDDVATRFKSS